MLDGALGHGVVELRGVQSLIELGAVPLHLLALERIRAIPVLLGGEQRAGERARSATGHLRGRAAGLRRHDGRIAAVDAVVRAAVANGDARRLDTHAVLHRVRDDVVHPADKIRLYTSSTGLPRLPLDATRTMHLRRHVERYSGRHRIARPAVLVVLRVSLALYLNVTLFVRAYRQLGAMAITLVLPSPKWFSFTFAFRLSQR